jgi:hypothetical protein
MGWFFPQIMNQIPHQLEIICSTAFAKQTNKQT